jgi:hypothetical protein
MRKWVENAMPNGIYDSKRPIAKPLFAYSTKMKLLQNIDKLPAQLFIWDAPDNRIPTLEPFIKKLCFMPDEGIEQKITFVVFV